MRNQLETWLLPDDEEALSLSIRSHLPTVFFIDHDDAGTPDVVARIRLQDCGSGVAYIWDAGTDQPERATESWQHVVHQKSVGAVVQFLRSRLAAEELVNGASAILLLSGRVATCFTGKGTQEQITLKNIAYGALDSVSTSEVVPVSPTTRDVLGRKCPGVRVGRYATEWCQQSGHLLRHVATKQLYCLPSAIAENAS
jgi:hypothetical protein